MDKSTAPSTVLDVVYATIEGSFKGRKVKNTNVVVGPVFSELYPAGTTAWRVNAHTDDRGGRGIHAGQITISCDRASGRISVFGEPRRNYKTGGRFTVSPAHRDILARLAIKIESVLEATEGYQNPDPTYHVHQAKTATTEDSASQYSDHEFIFEMFAK